MFYRNFHHFSSSCDYFLVVSENYFSVARYDLVLFYFRVAKLFLFLLSLLSHCWCWFFSGEGFGAKKQKFFHHSWFSISIPFRGFSSRKHHDEEKNSARKWQWKNEKKPMAEARRTFSLSTFFFIRSHLSNGKRFSSPSLSLFTIRILQQPASNANRTKVRFSLSLSLTHSPCHN